MTNERFKAHLYKSLYGFYQLIAWQYYPVHTRNKNRLKEENVGSRDKASFCGILTHPRAARRYRSSSIQQEELWPQTASCAIGKPERVCILAEPCSAVTHLCADGVDPNGAVQLLLGQATLERGCKALCDFSSVWTQYVEAHNTFLKYKIK